MPPNVVEPPMQDPEAAGDSSKIEVAPPAAIQIPEENYNFKLFQSILNLLVHILIGATVGITVIFGFRGGLPLGATPLHLVLCVTGYHLLMAEAILSLSPHNTWSANLKLVHKRRLHWILQILGSGLAIVGSFIKIIDKNINSINFNTLHGQFGLVALVFTTVSMVNGLASLYSYELRKLIPSNLSKLTHICFGTVAFAASSICLCYGFDKNSFRNWATSEVAYTVIAFTAAFTLIIIITPLITFFNKAKNVVTN